MQSHDLFVKIILTSRHFDNHLGFGILLNPMLFVGVCTPRLIVCITGWTKRVSVCCKWSFHCDCNCAVCITIILMLQTVPYHAPMFVGCCTLVYNIRSGPYCRPMSFVCCTLVHAQCMVPWIGNLAWPQLTLDSTRGVWSFLLILPQTLHRNQCKPMPEQKFLETEIGEEQMKIYWEVSHAWWRDFEVVVQSFPHGKYYIGATS